MRTVIYFRRVKVVVITFGNATVEFFRINDDTLKCKLRVDKSDEAISLAMHEIFRVSKDKVGILWSRFSVEYRLEIYNLTNLLE